MRFIEFVEKSHPVSPVKGKRNPAYLRDEALHTTFEQSWSHLVPGFTCCFPLEDVIHSADTRLSGKCVGLPSMCGNS